MKFLLRHFTLSWLVFFMIYTLVFLWSFGCLLTTVDEYDGGNRLAEIGTTVFNYYRFPLFIGYDTGFQSSGNVNVVVGLFSGNLLINCLFTTLIVNGCYQQVRKWAALVKFSPKSTHSKRDFGKP
jgi:hypothetical protein